MHENTQLDIFNRIAWSLSCNLLEAILILFIECYKVIRFVICAFQVTFDSEDMKEKKRKINFIINSKALQIPSKRC